MKKLRAYWIRKEHLPFGLERLLFPFVILVYKDWNPGNCDFLLGFMGVRLGLSHELKDTCWRYLRIWCSWQYFGSKTGEIGRGWTELHYEIFRALYSTIHHTLFALHKNLLCHWHLFGPFPLSLNNTTQCFGNNCTLIRIYQRLCCVVSCCVVLCCVVLCCVVTVEKDQINISDKTCVKTSVKNVYDSKICFYF